MTSEPGQDSPDRPREGISGRVTQRLAAVRTWVAGWWGRLRVGFGTPAKAVPARAKAWVSTQPPRVLLGMAAALVVVIAVGIAAALGGADSAPAAVDVAEGAGSTTQPFESETTSSPQEVFEAAVARSQVAGSYRFDAWLRLRSSTTQAEFRLVGWVDGSDRELRVVAGEETVSTTRVVDGTATIDDGSGPREVAIEDAGEAPGFDLLEQVDLVRVTDAEAEGQIRAEALAGFGLDDDAPKQGQVVVRYSGYVDGYTMWDPNGAWEVEVVFSDFGGEVRSS